MDIKWIKMDIDIIESALNWYIEPVKLEKKGIEPVISTGKQPCHIVYSLSCDVKPE